MSYCRFGDDSDVYVYATFEDTYECCACRLSINWGHKTAADMIAHLEKHRATGHLVPQYAIDRLRGDIDREGATDA